MVSDDSHPAQNPRGAGGAPARIYTIGHSNLGIDAFTSRLLAHGVRLLVDVRRFPASRRFPHFERTRLARALEGLGIAYHHEERLGGRREPDPRSPNVAIAEPMLRSYADHMSTDEFRAALDDLVRAAARRPTTVMCAEADPRRCHRQLLADALCVRGLVVNHIMDASRAPEHVPPSTLRLERGRLVYDGGVQRLDLDGGPHA